MKSKRAKKSHKSKNKKAKQRDKFKVGYYALAYLDLLNQKNVLLRMKDLPNSDNEYEEFKQLLIDSYGVVCHFRNNFEQVIKGINRAKQKSIYVDLTDEQMHIYNKFNNSGIQHQYFSDTVLYYTFINHDANYLPICDIYDLLGITASVFYTGLSKGIVSRGSIDVGIGSDFFKNEIYGPILGRAYELESTMAKYPRIVIGPGLVQYIQAELENPGNSHENNISKLFARKCKELIIVDKDGVAILDYMGGIVRKFPVFDDELYRNTMEFIDKEIIKFEKENNNKLYERYVLLKEYILK
ncbi:hypothetical protein HQ585_13680 [candidate division KSB1 bacterium]|nr:hypothetical protein [candidate division KSB1 bacterium]